MNQSITPHTLIVGGSHGISFELVKALLAAGGRVTALSRTEGQLSEEGLLGDESLQHLRYDVLQDEWPADQIPDSLTGFVYCPGTINLGAVRSVKADALRADLELNAVGALQTFQAVLRPLKASGAGSAVFFSTVAVDHGIAMHSYVAAAKGALQAMAKTWAAELAPRVRVNCVAPALTDTPLASGLLSDEGSRKTLAKKYPLGRLGSPVDMASAAAFLLSPQNSWITGQVIGVDGGMSSIVAL
ncbi:SDR family oxidoreductase [Roseiconus nitratireducens]|uniref:SDR family oxidoreductase n=1 Tax=Roseiconus nitratireducens TaxID=2605748 RepID=A0A5M6CZ14_9BACT|nr:SDR family oxidoreductase [Roseiconus nitratireducens]KAA5540464.1 SDR family oxidoreductase [Roseiconus nitratireducens]